MDNIKKAIEEFIGEYMPHIDNEYTYPVEEEDQRVFHKKLFTLLEMISKKVCKDTLLDNSKDGELFEDGFEADWVDYWQQTLKSLKE